MIFLVALHLAFVGQSTARVPWVPIEQIRNNALPFEDRRIRVCGILDHHKEMDRYYVYKRTRDDVALGVYLSAKPRSAKVGKRTCALGRIVFAIPRAKRDLQPSYTTADSPMDIAYSLIID